MQLRIAAHGVLINQQRVKESTL